MTVPGLRMRAGSNRCVESPCRVAGAFSFLGMEPGGTPWREGAERCALENGFPGPRVSDGETLSLQESAKSRSQNTELATLRQLYFGS